MTKGYNETLRNGALELQNQLVEWRRDFHRHAESAWTEFRTSYIVANELKNLGYEVRSALEVMDPEAMMGVPETETMQEHARRAIDWGVPAGWVKEREPGYTAVVGVLGADKPGPTVALRFDMDANDLGESEAEDHRPVTEGFCSINPAATHACGHDAHTAIGLGVARLLAQHEDMLAGPVKLLFQPAEEGVRGARSMVASGILDDVRAVVGSHIGFAGGPTGSVVCGGEGFLATTKLDASFKGQPSHAGGSPERGRNVLLAAAAAALNLHAITRHSEGASRINVGVMQAGTGRNVIPAAAQLKLETRGVNSNINDFMEASARRVLKAAAEMYGAEVVISDAGAAPSARSDDEVIALTSQIASAMPDFDTVVDSVSLGGSEDFTYMMRHVQERGGLASYVMVGTDRTAGHHEDTFDFDESILGPSVALLTQLAIQLQQTT